MDQELVKHIQNDQFAKYVGTKLVKVDPGYAVVKLEINENHFNGIHRVQGGAIFALADYAFAAATNSSGVVTVGINMNISYMKSPKGKVLTAEARETFASRKISHVDITIFDENKEPIAKAHGTGYRKQS